MKPPPGPRLQDEEFYRELDLSRPGLEATGEAVRQGLWAVRFDKPSAGVFDDFTVDLVGVPGFLFLAPQKYWTAR